MRRGEIEMGRFTQKNTFARNSQFNYKKSLIDWEGKKRRVSFWDNPNKTYHLPGNTFLMLVSLSAFLFFAFMF